MRIALCVFLIGCAADQPVSVATGELEAWVAGPSLPTPRANHCSAVVGDHVVVIGGNYKQADGSFTKTDEIHAAKLENGVLGAWQLAGKTKSPVTECTATSDGERLFIIDGIYDGEADGRQVYAGPLFGELTSIATLPDIAISSEATVRDDRLYLMDTLLPNEGDQTLTRHRALDGGEWASDDWGIGFRAQAQYAFTDRYVYTLGGYSGDEGNPAQDSVFVADLTGGNIRETTSLPMPLVFGEAIAIDDYVFVIGGRSQVFGGTASTKVFAAHVEGDGSLAAWTELGALPMARTNHEIVVVGDHLVIAGGADSAGGDANVLVSRARF
jgi:hypothetical protein